MNDHILMASEEEAMDVIQRLRSDNEKLRAALDRVASTGCDNFTRGDCWENGYNPDDDLGAYRVCDPCLAARALEETK